MSDTCQPPKTLDPHTAQCQQPVGARLLGPSSPCRSLQSELQSGVDEVQQVLQLLLQAPFISMVLDDPVEVPKVVQATLGLNIVYPCGGGTARSSPLRLDGHRAPGTGRGGRLAPGGATLPSPHTQGPSSPPKHRERLSGSQPPVPRAGPAHESGLGHLTADEPQGHRVYCAVTTPSVPASLSSGGSVCPPPWTMTRVTGITWQVCVSIR